MPLPGGWLCDTIDMLVCSRGSLDKHESDLSSCNRYPKHVCIGKLESITELYLLLVPVSIATR